MSRHARLIRIYAALHRTGTDCHSADAETSGMYAFWFAADLIAGDY